MNDKVCIVTVTYGKRWALLNRVLESIVNNDSIKNIIIVNNNSLDNISELAKEVSKKITVINLQENTGSANGYSIGIEEALKTNNEFIWLLDDDNKPKDNALKSLMDNWNNIKMTRDIPCFGLLSLRNDRKEFILAASKNNAKNIFPNANSFLGFHFLELPKKIFRKISNRTGPNTYAINKLKKFNVVEVPLAPYGGFFFNRNLISRIGFPDKKFYLYADDHEFTHRINKNGGKIFLDPLSIVEDIDHSWFIKSNRPFFISLLFSDEKRRVFYGVRNRVYFEQKDLMKNTLIYQFNKYILLSILKVFSGFSGTKERYQLILKAVKEGEEGNLGKVGNLN